MSREFLINIVFLIIINLLIKPFYVLVIEVGVQNHVGPADYGLFFALFNFCYIFQVVLDVGIQNYNSKTIAQDRSLVATYVPHIIGIKCILSVLFMLVIFGMGKILGYPSYYYSLLWVIGLNQILLSFILYLRTNLASLGHYRLDSVVSVIDKVILITLLGYFLWVSQAKADFTISWFLYCQTASLSITLAIVLALLYHRLGHIWPKVSLTFTKKFLKNAFPYALVILLMTLYTKVDAVMLERMLPDGKTEAGIYAAAYRLLDAVNMIGYLFGVLLLPMFANAIAQRQSYTELATLGFTMIMLLSISTALFCYYNGNEIMELLYTASTPYYARILQILIFGFIPMGVTYVFGTLLIANGNVNGLNILFVISIVINVGLNYLYIPEHKAIAASYTTLATQVFVALGKMVLVFKYCDLNPNLSLYFRLLLYGLVMIGVLMFLNTLGAIFIGLKLLACTLIGILVSLLFKLIDVVQIKKILFSDNINTFE